MAALFAQKGYGQLEPNRLSGITFGDIEAQAPAYTELPSNAEDATPIAELENGQFLCVIPDTKGLPGAAMGRVAVLPGAAPATAKPFIVFSERKQYDEREMYCDFVDKASTKVDGLLFPKLVGMTPDACVFTTNTLNCAKDATIAVGDVFVIGDDGYLTPKSSSESTFGDDTAPVNTVYQFEVTKVYTMPDGQPGIKFMCKDFVA